MSTWEIANIAAIKMGEFGFSTCDREEMNRVIKLKKADKLAEKSGEFGFSTLGEEGQKELLNNNPHLLRKSFLPR